MFWSMTCSDSNVAAATGVQRVGGGVRGADGKAAGGGRHTLLRRPPDAGGQSQRWARRCTLGRHAGLHVRFTGEATGSVATIQQVLQMHGFRSPSERLAGLHLNHRMPLQLVTGPQMHLRSLGRCHLVIDIPRRGLHVGGQELECHGVGQGLHRQLDPAGDSSCRSDAVTATMMLRVGHPITSHARSFVETHSGAASWV